MNCEKLSLTARKRGFSLVELLVVITIIGILSSIIIPAGQGVQKTMKKTKCQKTATELRSALTNYFSEYKRFPAVSSGGGGGARDQTIPTDASNNLMTALVGQDPTINRRGIQFYSGRPAKAPGFPGLNSSNGTKFELRDTFLSSSQATGTSNPYYVIWDADYDKKMQVPSRTSSGQKEYIYTQVAVWSYGPDGVEGSAGGTKPDDVFAY